MSFEWGDYEPYSPGILGPPNALPRAEARGAFKRCMETKPDRLVLLSRLLMVNGVELGTSDAAIQDLNDWFSTNVESDPERPGRLLPNWYSVVHDIALFLGDVMIERHANLYWEFFTWGKTNASFQRHVIMGFSTEDQKFHTNVDIDRMVSTYAHRIVESRGSIPSYGVRNIRGAKVDVDVAVTRHGRREIEADAFWRWLQMVAQRA